VQLPFALPVNKASLYLPFALQSKGTREQSKPEASFVIFFTHLCEKYYKGKVVAKFFLQVAKKTSKLCFRRTKLKY